ncbi:MAG: hypothetical protein HC892_16475 [Saprospiraceae bacterium]|nr:hypothetical protein [Saprospiraceae bacterium]
MNQDSLEQFILDHKASFDVETPSLNNWHQIEKQLEQQARKVRYLQVRKYVLMAAAIVGLLFTGGLIGTFLMSTNEQVVAEVSLENIAPELAETEVYYQQQIANKTKMLVALQQDTSVLSDIKEIDIFLEELKAELINTPKETQELVIYNIIKSYQTKLEILERVLNAMQLDSIYIQNSAIDEISI